MILELDIGNTRIKWRRLDELSGREMGQGAVAGIDELKALGTGASSPSLVRMVSVGASSLTSQISHWAEDELGSTVKLAEVTRSCGGVTNSYSNLCKMGSDRWLAMLAAFRRANGSCIVVDAGTALTIDVIDGEGQHKGGYIVPGLQLMAASLQNNTGIQLAETLPKPDRKLGSNTDETVINGIASSLLALIEQVVQGVCVNEPQTRVFFTGGDAATLAELVSLQELEVVPGLVMDGLAVACPFDSGDMR